MEGGVKRLASLFSLGASLQTVTGHRFAWTSARQGDAYNPHAMHLWWRVPGPPLTGQLARADPPCDGHPETLDGHGNGA